MPARPVGWPYWATPSLTLAPAHASFTLPVPEASIEKTGGAKDQWTGAPPALRERLRTLGFARLRPKPRSFAFGTFYDTLLKDGVPALITVDALFALSFLAVDAALADAERRVSTTGMRTLLERLDARLAAAEPGTRPDLTGGLHTAEGVVAVGLSLLSETYVPPSEVRDAVAAELTLIRAHAGIAASPILKVALDYAAFVPRGASTPDNLSPFLAAQWLARATFTFSADETTPHVDMSAARARTRGALLIARLVSASADADAPARKALLQMDRLDDLAFGDSQDASPIALANLAVTQGFDLHDARAIGDAAKLDHLRRAALLAVGTMELVPLRHAPESKPWDAKERGDGGAGASALHGRDIAAWLSSSDWGARAAERHASFYASGLDAIATWLGPSAADPTLPSAGTPPWQSRKLQGALAAWTLLRHASVPFARTAAYVPVTADARSPEPTRPSPETLIVVEPHPEAIASILGYVRQVSTGLMAVDALDPGGPSRETLAEVAGILEVALRAAEEETFAPASFAARSAELRSLPVRMTAVEARVGPAGGPFATIVYADPRDVRALEEGTTGIDALYAVVRNPVTGQPVLTVGAALAEAELWIDERDAATDQGWGVRLGSSLVPDAEPFAGTLAAP